MKRVKSWRMVLIAASIVMLTANIAEAGSIRDSNTSVGLNFLTDQTDNIHLKAIDSGLIIRLNNSLRDISTIAMASNAVARHGGQPDGPILYAANGGYGPEAGLNMNRGHIEEVTRIEMIDPGTGAEGVIIHSPDAKKGLVGGIDMGNAWIYGLRDGIEPQDAVNVRQLKSAIDESTNLEGSLSAALSALKPMQYDPYEPTQIMAGFGVYGGKKSIALGLAHYKNERVLLNVGFALNDQRTMGNVGVTYKFGKVSPQNEQAYSEFKIKRNPISHIAKLEEKVKEIEAVQYSWNEEREAMVNAMDSIKKENNQLRASNIALEKDMEQLKEQVAMLTQYLKK